MGLYEVILAPAVFVTDGTARIYQDVGDLLELTDDEAAGFDPPEAVRQIGTEAREDEATEPVAVPSGAPVTFVDPPPAAVVEPPVDVAPLATDSGDGAPTPAVIEPEPEKPPRRSGRQGKPVDDGQD